MLSAALGGWLLLAAGCQVFPKTSTVSSNRDWDHNNLYNTRAPYPRLYVEIDAVEGYAPSERDRLALEEFLRRYCDKPGGITVKVDTIIPRQTARNRTADSLAIEYMGGPDVPDAAYLYVLYYNGRLQGKDRGVENPSFSHQPYPIVYIDRAYHMLGNPFGRTFSRAVLLHETGHALGLCATSSHHAKGGHCTNHACRMNPALNFNITRFVMLRNPWDNVELCKDCIADLDRNRSSPAVASIDFWHGYYRRREAGYQVLGLPGLKYVRFGEPLAAPDDQLKEARRLWMADLASGRYANWYNIEAFDPFEHLDALARFAQEKDDHLRMAMKDLFLKLFDRLDELGETEAENVLPLLSDEFIALAQEYPEERAKFVSLREELAAPCGYGASLTRQPRQKKPDERLTASADAGRE
jgi:hypothetical protein